MNEQKELVAHLMRRAGFGATKQEIESLASLKYEKIVAVYYTHLTLPKKD